MTDHLLSDASTTMRRFVACLLAAILVATVLAIACFAL